MRRLELVFSHHISYTEELLADAPDDYVQNPKNSTSYEKLYANKIKT